MFVEGLPHPRGEPGLGVSVDKVREYVHRSMEPPERFARLRAWSMRALKDAGNPATEREQLAALLRAVRARAKYVPDPVDVEFMQTAEKTLCLPGAELCFFGGDCDDLLISMLASSLSVGIHAAIVLQEYPGTDHVIGGGYVDAEWCRVDPSYFDEVDRSYRPRRERWIDVMTGKVLCDGSPMCTPRGQVSDREMIAARPRGAFVGVAGVGQAGQLTGEQAAMIAAWSAWLEAADLDMLSGIDRVDAAVELLAETRQRLSLPALAGAWDANVAQGWATVRLAGLQAHQYALEALDGSRPVVWMQPQAQAQGTIGIVAKSPDEVAIWPSTDGITVTTPQPAGGSGQAGNALLAIAIVAGVTEIVTVAEVYLAVRAMCAAFEQRAVMQTQRDLAEQTSKWIAGGATPEQAKALLDALGGATATAARAAQPAKEASLFDAVQSFITGLTAIVAIGGVVYLVDRFAPRSRAAAA